jgi:hypothetical protein
MFNLINRGELDATTENELENFIARLKGLWLTEHTEDGGHGDITAGSGDFSGDVTIAGDLDVAGKGTYGGSLELADVTDGSYGTAMPGFSIQLTDYGNAATLGPAIRFGSSSALGWTIVADELHTWRGLKFLSHAESGAFDCAMQLSSDLAGTLGTYYLRPNGTTGVLNLGGPTAVFGLGSKINVVTATTVDSVVTTAFTGFFEKGRSLGVGEWADQPYATGNFTTNGPVWTVNPGDVQKYRYSVVGHTMHLQFAFVATTLAAIATRLTIVVPGGYTVVGTTYGTYRAFDGGAVGPGLPAWTVGASEASGGFVNLYSTSAGGGWNTSAATLYVQGHMTFEVA